MYADLFKRPVHFIFRVGQLMGRQMGREEFQANILQERNQTSPDGTFTITIWRHD